MNLKYQCECGCEYVYDDLITLTWDEGTPKKRKLKMKLSCPVHKDHDGLLKTRSINCNKCNAVRFFSASGGAIPKLCKPCIAKTKSKNPQKKAANRAKSRKIKKKKRNTFSCGNFKNLCGECIKPYCECKMYQKAA